MILIVLDAGHGGTDPGAVRHGLQEKDINRKVVDYVKEYLGKKVTILETRKGDETVAVINRRNIIAKSKADLAISFHCNSVKSDLAHGFETFRRFNHGRELQNFIHDRVYRFLQSHLITDRKKKVGDFIVLNTLVPSILVENLFISNRKESQLLGRDSFLQELGLVYANGILEFLKIPSGGANINPADYKEVNMKDIQGHWAEEEIKRVIAEGLMTGFPDGTFQPDEALTRGQFAAVLGKLLDRK
ncbi:MAG: Sporulation-specific N-acetylmuramoyl-L-alanine amidase [candidate division WS2 bacterium]|uniref:Sporulation-specific N-acetylmuramoyl-L-alanine amidase n=1 Tax=Psychracetigena formicireducens TaxID=2986056 RepID=A0A9E2F1N3_PSYF1|nr:Sporulation-specific N-acetylmuramoyl-L-alanine amidase [Candidatus Psychracetigena formicireducens]